MGYNHGAMGFIRLRAELRALQVAVDELRNAIEKHSESVCAAQKAHDENQKGQKLTPVLVSYDKEANASQNAQNTAQEKIARWTKWGVIAAAVYAAIAALTMVAIFLQYKPIKKSADAAYLSAEALRPRLAIIGLTPQTLTVKGLPMDGDKLHVWFQVPDYGPMPAQDVQICEFDNVGVPSKIGRLPYGNCQSSAAWGYGSSVFPR
jgi:hypothetical protein